MMQRGTEAEDRVVFEVGERRVSHVKCTQDGCSALACMGPTSQPRSGLCLMHFFTVGSFARCRWRVISRSAVEAQREAVEKAFGEARAVASEFLGSKAAEQIMTIGDAEDPLAALIDDSKRRADKRENARQAPQPREKHDALTGRKRTRPAMLWATDDDDKNDLPLTNVPTGDPCQRCGSTKTEKQPRGGGNIHSGKVETWGRKDDGGDVAYETLCLDCHHIRRHDD